MAVLFKSQIKLFGSSEYFVGKDINPAFAQPSVIPAKAGGRPAGMTEFLPNLRECVSLPIRKSEQPVI
jgi:hypothetical protein